MATGNFDPLMARGVRHGRLQYEVQPATPGASLRGRGPPPDRSVMWKSTRWPSLKEDAPTTSLACKNTSGRPSWEMKPYRLRASNHFTTPVAYQPPFLERVPRTVPGAQTRRGRECPPNPHHSSTLAGPCSWDLSGSGASGFKSAAPFGYPSIVDQEGRWHVEFRYDGSWAAQTRYSQRSRRCVEVPPEEGGPFTYRRAVSVSAWQSEKPVRLIYDPDQSMAPNA